ncbi:MAG: protein kinase [Planctomycetota bacterium]
MQRIGRYEVREELGRGGAGAVFRAWDPVGNTWVAIKLLLAAHDERAIRRFQREVRTLVNLRHPNVTPVRDWGDAQGRPFLVMDLIEGQTLEERVNDQGPCSDAQAAEIGIALAEALAAAHGQGVLHRDVKPSNVLMRGDTNPVLTDFGLAKDVALDASQLTVEGGFMGTLGFAAPEQARGQSELLGPATDVYGLGATLYYALCGQAPLEGTSVIELLASMDRPPTPLRSVRSEVDEGLAEVVHRCLQTEPGARYTDCSLVARDLGRFLEGTLAGPKKASKPPLGLALSLTLTAAAAVGLGLYLRQHASAPERGVSEGPAVGEDGPADPPAEDPLDLRLKSARAALERGHWEAALHESESALAVEPEHPDALHARWKALLGLQDPRAFEAAQRAVAREPRADVCLQLAADWLQQGDDAEAERVIRLGLEAAPQHAGLLEEYGLFLHVRGRNAEAVDVLRRARALQPTYATTLTLGAALYACEQNVEALEAFDAALKLQPDSVQALCLRGSVLTASSRFEDALAPLLRAWGLSEGEYGPVVLPLVRALRETQRHQEALAVANRALALEPQNVSFLVAHSQVVGLLGREEDELADLDAILALEPNHSASLHNRAILRFERKRYEEAYADSARVVELEPEWADAWTQLGAAAFVLGRQEQARDAYGKAIELDPERALLRVGRAQAAQRLLEFQTAIDDYLWVLERQPDYHAIRQKLGEAYAQAGRFAEARQALEQVLREAEADSQDHDFAELTWKKYRAELEAAGSRE